MATSTIPKSPDAFVNGSFTKVHSSISNVERANYKKSGNICAAEVTFTTSAAISDVTAVLFQGLPNARQGAQRFAAFNKLSPSVPLILAITTEGKIVNQWSAGGIPAGQYQADFVYITED